MKKILILIMFFLCCFFEVSASPNNINEISNNDLSREEVTSQTWREYIAHDLNTNLFYRSTNPYKEMFTTWEDREPVLLNSNHQFKFYVRFVSNKKSLLEPYTDFDLMGVKWRSAATNTADLMEDFVDLWKEEPGDLGFYFEDLTNGERSSLYGDIFYTAASTWKLAFGLMMNDEINKGTIKKNMSLTYLEQFKVAGDILPNSPWIVGNSYSIDFCMRDMLDWSNNIGASLMWSYYKQHIGDPLSAYRNYGDEEIPKYTRDENSITPHYACNIAKYLLTHQDEYQYAISFLKNAYSSTYGRIYVKNDDTTKIMQKVGFYGRNINTIIMNNGTHPYVAAFYTKNINNAKDFLGRATSVVNNFVNEENNK